MADLDRVVDELRLLREQQWEMHRALVTRMDEGFARLDGRLDQTNARLDQTNARLDQTNARLDLTIERLDQAIVRLDHTVHRLDNLEQSTASGFAQTVERVNKLQLAFERFVELSLDERRKVWPEIDGLKRRMDAVEDHTGIRRS